MCMVRKKPKIQDKGLNTNGKKLAQELGKCNMQVGNKIIFN